MKMVGMSNTGYNGEPWFSYLPTVNQMAKFKDIISKTASPLIPTTTSFGCPNINFRFDNLLEGLM